MGYEIRLWGFFSTLRRSISKNKSLFGELAVTLYPSIPPHSIDNNLNVDLIVTLNQASEIQYVADFQGSL